MFTTVRHWSLSQATPSHPIYVKIHFDIIFTFTSRSSEWSLPFRFPTKILNAFLISYHACYTPAHLSPLDLITLIILGEAYKLKAPHYAIFSSIPPLPPSKDEIFPSALCPQTPSVFLPQHERSQSFTPIRYNTQNHGFVYFNLYVFIKTVIAQSV
jgi:hypothetical protein